MGTTPAGIDNEQQAATWVRGMFGRIAPRYDLLNHLLSMNIDRYWRARTVSRVSGVLSRPGARVLDVCCGTGDLMLALEFRGSAHVYGSDFCHPMLVAARHKVEQSRSRSKLFEADALRLPVADGSLDLVTIAFGFRNLANYQAGFEELLRVLRPGGLAAILEFSTPPNPLLARLYGFYSRNILPTIGGLISGSKEAYSYLPESVRKFPGAPDLADQMRAAGFSGVRFERMTAGIVALHLGQRL
ncbi:MAG: bifunctional demethylmenaquinone methyltransferase/2-methoxy-6-polyprenyl-1,4-benzoquinol methylase UbiE [Bryobacteraceae bacterium]|jgi:demethylmenaquinone methyltransferase / 2-methoxy-6-polyprenyl-1,4-benzoquinol methylase